MGITKEQMVEQTAYYAAGSIFEACEDLTDAQWASLKKGILTGIEESLPQDPVGLEIVNRLKKILSEKDHFSFGDWLVTKQESWWLLHFDGVPAPVKEMGDTLNKVATTAVTKMF